MRRSLSGLLIAATVLVTSGIVTLSLSPSQAVAQNAETNAAAQDLPQVPKPEVLLVIIRSSVMALGHAIETGNFSVLRDLGTPSFRLANSPAQLAFAFKDLMDRNVRLAPVAVLTPQLTVPPLVDNTGVLTVEGRFPSQPVEIIFRLRYQVANGRWRLASIQLNTAQP